MMIKAKFEILLLFILFVKFIHTMDLDNFTIFIFYINTMRIRYKFNNNTINAFKEIN